MDIFILALIAYVKGREGDRNVGAFDKQTNPALRHKTTSSKIGYTSSVKSLSNFEGGSPKYMIEKSLIVVRAERVSPENLIILITKVPLSFLTEMTILFGQ